jgi:hypothetical protein
MRISGDATTSLINERRGGRIVVLVEVEHSGF